MSVDHSGMRLGKRAPRVDAKRLMLGKYLDIEELPPAPESQDWAGALEDSYGMLLNDQLGCCTITALAHAIKTFTANVTGMPAPIVDASVLAHYSRWDGFQPGNPATDQGGIEVDVLNWFRKETFDGHALLAYVDPDPQHIEQIRQGILIFGGVYAGIALPLSAATQEEWDVVSGPDGAPGSWGGHAMWFPRYNKTGPVGVTWGKMKQLTWDFWQKYVDEAHVLLSQDFIVATSGESVSGFSMDRLHADLQVITA